MPLDVLVEAVLFYKATPQKKVTLMKLFDVTEDQWNSGIKRLKERLEHGAMRLVQTETEIQLVTAPELAEFIEAMRKDELSGDIGKAGAEALAIILYQGPVSRSDIDRVRGVNSSFILRNLLVRGLIERKSAGNSYKFTISPTLLLQLGISEKQTLPRYSEFLNALETFSEETV